MYVKLFSQILDSSIWLESGDTRIVWITLLAAMDQDGFARFAMVENLARRANVSTDSCSEAVRVLESPDPNSSDDSNEGRRIERVPGGWLVLNSQKYRELGSAENRRERVRGYVQKHREKVKSSVSSGNQDVISSNQVYKKSKHMQKQKQKQIQKQKKRDSEGSTHDENGEVGNSQTGRVAKPTRPSTATLDETFLEELKTNPAYRSVSVLQELGKAQSWCRVNHRVCTRRFFVNWLNRCDKPLTSGNEKVVIGDVEVDVTRFSDKTRGNAAVMARFVEEGKTNAGN